MGWGRLRECGRPALLRALQPECFSRGEFRASLVLPLGIACEHLDDEIMQTVVELLLKSPGKLAVFNLARPEEKDISVNLRLRGCGLYLEPARRRRIADLDFDAFRCGARAEDEQWVLVAGEFGAHF